MTIEVPLTAPVAWFCLVVVGSLPAFLLVVNTVTGACFAAGPASLRRGGARTVACVVLLTIWQYYVYMCLWHRPAYLRWLCEARGICEDPTLADVVDGLSGYDEVGRLAMYHAVMVMWLWSWRRAIMADVTCAVRTAELRKAQECVREAGGRVMSEKQGIRLRGGNVGKLAEGDDVAYAALAAVKDRHRAEGARTCHEIGGGVVAGFDHYCPLINNAVGRANRKYFVLTMLYQVWSGVYLLSDGVPVATDYFMLRTWDSLTEPQICVGTVLSIHINIACLFLLLSQVVVLPIGISTIELFSYLPWVSGGAGSRRPSFPSFRNVTRELGPTHLWLLPVTHTAA